MKNEAANMGGKIKELRGLLESIEAANKARAAIDEAADKAFDAGNLLKAEELEAKSDQMYRAGYGNYTRAVEVLADLISCDLKTARAMFMTRKDKIADILAQVA